MVNETAKRSTRERHDDVRVRGFGKQKGHWSIFCMALLQRSRIGFIFKKGCGGSRNAKYTPGSEQSLRYDSSCTSAADTAVLEAMV